jgi:hypothetical protein
LPPARQAPCGQRPKNLRRPVTFIEVAGLLY